MCDPWNCNDFLGLEILLTRKLESRISQVRNSKFQRLNSNFIVTHNIVTNQENCTYYYWLHLYLQEEIFPRVKSQKKALTFQNQVLQIVILVFSKKGGKENKNLVLYKCSKWVPSCFRDAGNAIYLYRICQMSQIKGILNQTFHEEKSQSTPSVSSSPHDIKIYMTTLCMHTNLHFCSKKYDLKVQINFHISHYSSL
jgi:hypothetical protein